MTFADLKKRVAFLAQDPTMRVIPDDQYGEFINDAVRDLAMKGWLTPISEDTSLTMAADTYEYAIPDNFAYVTELREESDTSPTTYDIITPEHQWRMGTISDAPYFILDSYLWAPRAGKAFKVVGQRRPTTYTSDSEAVEANFEAFLRERSAALALYYIAGLPEPNITRYKQDVEGDSPPFRRPADAEGQLDQRTRVLLRLADIKYATSERMATYHPQEFRVDPSGQNVPGR